MVKVLEGRVSEELVVVVFVVVFVVVVVAE